MEQIDSQEVVTSQNDDAVDTEQVETEQTETKPQQVESKEAKIARLKRQLERLTKDEQPAQQQSKKPSLKEDYGKLAYLAANGIKAGKELELVEQYEGFGKTLQEIVENKYFLNDLKEMREGAAVQGAAPSSSKRSAPSARDSVQYWLMKGELPPTDMPQLRREVVNAKIKADQSGARFASNPVISQIQVR